MSKKKENSEQLTNKPQLAQEIIETEIPDFLVSAYNKYISYISAGRVLCNYKDGFLNIYRRTLYAAYKRCRNHLIKASSLNAFVSGNYSPHGESPSATISLISNGFIDIMGSNENNFGVEYLPAAAPRYIEVKLNCVAELLFLNNDLLPYVDYNLSELSTPENEIYEPLWLPVLLPGMYTAIGYGAEFESYMEKGIKPVYPRYSVLSLLKYVINYLETGKFNKNLVYYQYHNMLKKCNDDTNYKFEEEFKCVIEIDDEDNVHIKAKPPFANMLNMLKNIPYIDLTSTSTDISFPKKYYSTKMKTNIKFNCIAYKLLDTEYENVSLKPYSLQTAILTILDNLKNILYPRYFNDMIKKTKDTISEYQLLQIAHDKYVNQHIPYDQMTDDEKKVLNKHRASTFMSIQKKINELNSLLQSYITRSQNIDKEIYNLYIDAREKAVKYLKEYWKEEKVKFYDITNI